MSTTGQQQAPGALSRTAPAAQDVQSAENNREALIGSYAKASALLDAVARGDANVDPGLVDLTERLAIRILTRHHGWVTVAPGELRRSR